MDTPPPPAFRPSGVNFDNTVELVHEKAWAVHARCSGCGKVKTWRPSELAAAFPPHVTLGAIAERLVCGECGGREGTVYLRQDVAEASERNLARHLAETGTKLAKPGREG